MQERPSSGPVRRGLARFGRGLWANPIPTAAALGLSLGAALTWLYGRPLAGEIAWYSVLLAGGIPLVYGTLRKVLRGELASDIIAAAAIVGAIVLEQPFAGVIIVLMQGGGESIERYAFQRASGSLQALLERAPKRARRRAGAAVEEIPADDVRPGDLLVVRPGDLVPVDGRIVGAPALIDDSTITGEPYPRLRPAGDRVLSGSVCAGEAFDLLAERVSRESEYARIVALVERASHEKPRIQRLADRYAVWFTPLAFVLALGAAIYHADPLTALAVLVVATPCPLLLATPIAVLGTVDRAAEFGLVTKGGGALEELARTRAVLFDKTGTLTTGRPEPERIVAFPPWREEEVLALAASVEQLSSHPLAQAVLRRAAATGTALTPAQDSHEFPGSGLAAQVGPHRVLVGSKNLFRSQGVPAIDQIWPEIERTGPVAGRLVSLVGVDGRPAGALVFTERERPETAGLVARLRRLGVVHIGLLTGDRKENAIALAERVGIPEVEAELLPEQKVERVAAIRRRVGTTVMVGDGINDAAALATASVGIAMGAHGAGVSAEAADMVLLTDDLTRVPDGIALGQRMLRIANQGILFGLGASIVLMVVATTGLIPPALGAVIQEVLDAAVILNALRVLAGGREIAPRPSPARRAGSASRSVG